MLKKLVDGDNKEAGKLSAGGGDAEAVKKAAAAVSAVSGEQILKAIVEAAEKKEQEGKKADKATNPIEAAIGTDEAGAAFKNEMKKSDKIAAAIVLRGLAKDGKFAGAAGGNGNKEAIKSAVESAVGKVSKWLEEMIKAAGKAADEGKGDALKGVKEAGGGDNKEAGKLFAVGAGGVAAADDIKKAAAAVSAVSGEQILKAIVEAAEEKDQAGKKANAATNPIEAAIGTADAAVDFGNDMKKRNDKIAAAIVLRGLAKDGKFAAAAGNETIESAVESAVGKVSKWLDEMIKAANEAATKGGTGDGSEKIGDSGAANAGVKADKDSVNGIAKGIKGIVEAAGKADGGTGGALKGVTAAGDNKEAGKLFAVGAGGDAAADADIKKAAAAVSAVSGEQILKAIVEAAEKGEQKGKKADAAKNPIEAAIGTAEAGVDFGNEMKKNDKIQD